MAELKTRKNDASVEDFLNGVENEKKRNDSLEIVKMMQEVTGEEPVMWGDSIVGFGSYTYKYASGRTGDWMMVGFSPRKQNLTLYIMPGFDQYDELLGKLGKYTTGKSCLYIKKLEDVDQDVLRELVKQSVEYMRETSL
ncbi:hypothetical protein J2755_002175 [Methanohalophilus levihalophilus]|uniref:DUF1801 domain-containing protein n=1 Tax=Methanohalophilus levihalophilus TaxID=1431282 RepID=UPI001AE5AC9F|nr:DUF1801 domain-containing protein [Methanohalophilus levihalophilus]MBP2031212.1 hypothetical protein [Methanohalophilus levihalophilus]